MATRLLQNYLEDKDGTRSFAAPSPVQQNHNTTMQSKDRIILAVDVDNPDAAMKLVSTLGSVVGSFKFGLELIYAMLASILEGDAEQAAKNAAHIRDLFRLAGRQLFLDGKFDDIPNTVGAAAKIVGQNIKVGMFNVHASAGTEAMMAAAQNAGASKTLALTVLTSREENDAHLDFGKPSKAAVLHFARNAKMAGLTGIVCSPQELQLLNSRPELKGQLKVTPGIRSPDDPPDDQKRTMTAREAIAMGADYVVVGRPITKAADPVVAAQKMASEISLGLRDRFALELFGLKNIKFGAFKLKLHETQPQAPLSPIYLNIRGLPEWLYALAGDILHDLVIHEGITDFDYVIGIPKAGEPIGMALAKALGKPHIRIKKEEGDGGRHISSQILDPFQGGSRVLLVDDLVTRAGTKREAIASVEANGLKVVATVVLYDREQGGLAELNREGHKVVAASKLSEALELLVAKGKITSDKKDEVTAYIAAN